MDFKHIDKIGLEFEGAWFTTPPRVHHDGSLRFPRTTYKHRGEDKRINVGELSSEPFGTLTEAHSWINQYWPDKRNKSCGFHIHVSVKDKLRYGILTDKEFYELFKTSAYAFGKKEKMSNEFFHRLSGKNRFCKAEHMPETQLSLPRNVRDQRYTQLNYCLNLHGTLENRMPTGAMPKTKAIKVVDWFVNLVEDYINDNFQNPYQTEVLVESNPLPEIEEILV